MKDHIMAVLQQIEMDYMIKILYACDAGSRALGFAAQDSDYDVRFIYIHKQDWYLSIDQQRDVIEIPKEDSLSITIHPKLDVTGWELTKALRLFRKSNPSLVEWLNSKYVYCDNAELLRRLKSMQNKVVLQKPFINHHLNLAKRNFIEMQKKEKWSVKVYLYILRSILSAKWFDMHQQIPPVEFGDLLEILENSDVKRDARELQAMKQRGDHDLKEENNILNEFIKREIEAIGKSALLDTPKAGDHTESLNDLFRLTLKEAWH